MPYISEQLKKLIVLLIIFAVLWQIYNIIYRQKYGDYIGSVKVAEVPHSVKCFFDEPGCEDGDIDGWSIVYALIYFIIGLIIPNQYLAVVVISILFELVQPYFGNKSRYIINPLVNITGYSLGSLFSKHINSYKEKYQVLEN